MTTVTDRPGVLPATVAAEPEARSSSAMGVALALPAVALAVVSLLVGSEPSAAEVVRAVLVVLWAAAGATLTTRRRHSRLGPIVLGGATVGALGALANAVASHHAPTGAGGVIVDLTVRLSAALLPAIAMHFLLAMPQGHLETTGRRRAAAAMYAVSALTGLALMSDRDALIAWPLVLLWLIALGGRAGRRPRPLPDRRRHRSPAHAVGRVGDGRGRRGGARRHRPERAHRPSRRSRGVGHRRDGRRSRRAHRQHPLPGGRPRRPAAHPHRLAGRPDGAGRRRVRRGGAGARPHARGLGADAAAALDGSGRAGRARLAAGPSLAVGRRQPHRVRRAGLPGRVAADVGHPPHPRHPDGRAAAAALREPAQDHEPGLGRGLDRRERALRVGHGRPAPGAGAAARRREGAPGRRPGRRVRRPLAGDLAEPAPRRPSQLLVPGRAARPPG